MHVHVSTHTRTHARTATAATRAAVTYGNGGTAAGWEATAHRDVQRGRRSERRYKQKNTWISRFSRLRSRAALRAVVRGRHSRARRLAQTDTQTQTKKHTRAPTNQFGAIVAAARCPCLLPRPSGTSVVGQLVKSEGSRKMDQIIQQRGEKGLPSSHVHAFFPHPPRTATKAACWAVASVLHDRRSRSRLVAGPPVCTAERGCSCAWGVSLCEARGVAVCNHGRQGRRLC